MMNASTSRKINAVDLFCGIGGLTHGLRESGIDVRAGIDTESSCKHAYEINNGRAEFINADVRQLRFDDIAPYYDNSDIKVLVGCAPCQPFSSHTRKLKRSSEEENCSLVNEFARLVKEGMPDIISMENVPGLVKRQEFHHFVQTLENLGYKSNYEIVQCLDYGIPQTRKRLVLLASKLGEVSLIRPTGKRATVSDFIRNLPEIESGQAEKSDSTHTSLKLSEKNMRRIKQSKPGGAREGWDADIVCQCHKNTYYPAPYGRMRWDAPAPTITTQFCYYSTGRFGHPEQNRTISLREGARLQTFPMSYEFSPKNEKFAIKDIARHIGNAVPVKLAKAIGQSIVAGAS